MSDAELDRKNIDTAFQVGAELMRNRIIALLMRELSPAEAARITALVSALEA